LLVRSLCLPEDGRETFFRNVNNLITGYIQNIVLLLAIGLRMSNLKIPACFMFGFLIGLPFDPEKGSDMFFENII
jgi:hypothetical protein